MGRAHVIHLFRNVLHAYLLSWEMPLETPEKPVEKILTEIANPVEAVVNILYLIKEERHDPEKILHLASLAEAPVEQLTTLLRGGLN